MTSKSEKYLNSRSTVPLATANMAKQVSLERRASLEQEVNQGSFRDGTSVAGKVKEGASPLGIVTSSGSGIKKYANVISSSGTGAGYRGMAGDALRQTPEVYSPLWLTSNLNLPRDKITINAWCRAFFALNPIVMNSISLHSTYPISKLNIKCKDPKIEQYFNEMIEEIDLMNICVQLAQEYWLLGEAFVHANLGDDGKWDRLVIQNPDYMVVKKTPIASEPIIMMKPDHTLREIVFKNTPDAIEQRGLIDEHVIDCVKRGQNIPMNNFNMSYIARRISPYEIRGTGLPVSIFRQLALFDQYRECFDENTEVFTDSGFKTFKEANQNNCKIGCYNPNNNQLEYHMPLDYIEKEYNGDMIHFNARNIDVLVTPGHEMWATKEKMINGKKDWLPYSKVKAEDIYNNSGTLHRFKCRLDWQGKSLETVDVLGKQIPIKLYLKFLGYLITEGCLTSNNVINFVQTINSDCCEDMKNVMSEFASYFDREVKSRIIDHNNNHNFKVKPQDQWSGNIYHKELNKYFTNLISSNDDSHSWNKVVPDFVMGLNKELLTVFLNVCVLGDGSHVLGKKYMSYRFYTSSKRLAEQIYEIAFKVGYSPSISSRKRHKDKHDEIMLGWTDSPDGSNPNFYNNSNVKHKKVSKVAYNGKVYCFTVPTGLIVTRRNGRIGIHGNCNFVQASNLINPMTLVKIGSAQYKPTLADIQGYRDIWEQAQYDKDFKIFTQNDVTVEKIGSGAGVMDTSANITQLIKEMMMGLLVPSVLMDGGADTTYANGGVALDVLRQRYMQFRNMLATWLKTKIFAPISNIQEFYEYKDKKKNLIIPEIDWNYMSLFDAGDYVSAIKELAAPGEGKRVSVQTLYRSLGLEYEDEVRKMRKEDIQEAIRKKEVATLGKMPLNELRALTEDDEINEVVESPLPGEQTSEEPPAGGDAGGIGGGMDIGAPGGGLDLGGGGAGGLPGLDLGGGSPPGEEPAGGASPPTPPA